MADSEALDKFDHQICMTKILIIVCAYNEEDHIGACLKSILHAINLSSAPHRFKLVCVDNSSTDDTFNLARSFHLTSIEYEYIKIEHSPLCVSRNTYKFYTDFDYIAYLDGDGSVEPDWAESLIDILDSINPEIVSGPVLPLTDANKPNGLWEVFYDSSIYGREDYIIGANMCFSTKFLESVGGFPFVFASRGDETCLLLKARLLGLSFNVHYKKNLIAYNHFPVDRMNFLKEQFNDGIRSSQIVRLSRKSLANIPNVIFRLVRLFSLILSIFLLPVSYKLAGLYFLLSIALSVMWQTHLVSQILRKVVKNSNPAKPSDGFFVLASFYIFDLGFLIGFFLKNSIPMEAILSSPIPVRVISDDR
ncbi:glycosyltransferase family 2 protein [Gammaproteobacteria bacterium]|nr:glycosyltransferase family 2 protein [Gammaproteobacteria bacterium]